MGERITIVLDPDVHKELRDEQAKKIKEENRSISFSRIVNDRLRKGYKLPPKVRTQKK